MCTVQCDTDRVLIFCKLTVVLLVCESEKVEKHWLLVMMIKVGSYDENV